MGSYSVEPAHLVVDFLANYTRISKNILFVAKLNHVFSLKLCPSQHHCNLNLLKTILQDVQKHIIPGITHWQSPGFFQSNGSTGNFLGEMLLTGFNTVGFNWLASPAATELEMVVMEWLLKLLQLPKSLSFSSNCSYRKEAKPDWNQ